MKNNLAKKTVRYLLATTLLTTLWGQSAHAADPNNPSRILKSQQHFTCTSDAWSITIREYMSQNPDGTLRDGPGEVKFSGMSMRTRTLRELPYNWAPDPNYPRPAPGFLPIPELQSFGPIVGDPNKPNNGRVCATDGSGIGYGQNYYILTKYVDTPWKNTQIIARLDIENTLGLDAGQILAKYRGPLTNQASVNAGPLPPTNFCASAVLEFGCFSGRPETNTEAGADYGMMGRVSIVDIAMNNPGASAADIYHYMRGDAWGTDIADVRGMTGPWVSVLENLGIINTPAIIRRMKGEVAGIAARHDGGRLIIRKIETKHSYDIIPNIDDDDDLQLIIKPKVKPALGSWPTNQLVDQTQPAAFPNPGGEGTPNPNYCAANDPYSTSYIPQYMADQEVILELDTDIWFLSDAQLDRIEDTGWRITEKQKS